MQKLKYSLITFLLVILPSALTLAAPPTQQPPGFVPFGFRPLPQDNARGTPPQSTRRSQSGGNTFGGNQPGPYGYRRDYEYSWQRQFSTSPPQDDPRYTGQPQPRNSSTAPYLETSLSSTDAYVQQTLILTLNVISGSNIATVHTQLPHSEAVVFRKMGEPAAQTRVKNGVREIVNTLHYLLTPLREGEIKLDPVRLKGSFANGQKFTRHRPATTATIHQAAGSRCTSLAAPGRTGDQCSTD